MRTNLDKECIPMPNESRRCGFGGCEAPADLHMAMLNAEGRPYLERDVCRDHYGLELAALRPGRTLTVRLVSA